MVVGTWTGRRADERAITLELMLHLSGPAQEEAYRLREELGRLPSVCEIEARMHATFIPLAYEKIARNELKNMRQDGRDIAVHVMEFRKKASQLNLSDAQLLDYFEDSLDPSLGMLVKTHAGSLSYEGAVNSA